MNTLPRFSHEVATAELRLGELAEATEVAAATLRGWESRHGFPRAAVVPGAVPDFRTTSRPAHRVVASVQAAARS